MRRIALALAVATLVFSGCSDNDPASPDAQAVGTVSLSGMLEGTDGQSHRFDLQLRYDTITDLRQIGGARLAFRTGPVSPQQRWHDDAVDFLVAQLDQVAMSVNYSRRETDQVISGALGGLTDPDNRASLTWTIETTQRTSISGDVNLGDIYGLPARVMVRIVRDGEQMTLEGTAQITIRGTRQMMSTVE